MRSKAKVLAIVNTGETRSLPGVASIHVRTLRYIEDLNRINFGNTTWIFMYPAWQGTLLKQIHRGSFPRQEVSTREI